MADPSEALSTALSDSPHAFLQPSLPLFTDTVAYLKHALDPVAADVSSTQHQRQQAARKKRKRGEKLGDEEVLRLRQIHTSGFTVEQIWEQARRVIGAVAAEAEKGLEDIAIQQAGNGHAALHSLRDEGADAESVSSLGEEGVDYEVEGVDGDDHLDEDDESEELEFHDAPEEFEEDSGLDENEVMGKEPTGKEEAPEQFVADKFGLNDGFFSIDDFNRKSEFLEQQDARGDDDGAASDEEDVDWDADPLAGANTGADMDGALEQSEDDDEADGPTFGDPDASSEDEDEDIDGGDLDMGDGISNTNNVMYADFFAPPAQKKKKSKRGRPNPHNFPETSGKGEVAEAAQEEDMEHTMAAVHRDLFDDEESEEDDEEPTNDLDPADPKSRKSAHERRKAALAEEIRKLEAANVAKREWTLAGEARAAERPVNSLLEEDLEFERAGKPVPVITAEVSESIEDLIKRRILAHDFQDIARRRPDDLATGKDGRRGTLDYVLEDSRSKKGLAEEYEEEHLRRTDPNFVDVKDERQKKEEKEIEALWRKVCSDLDSLSSWHFRPKAPAPQLDIRVDAPAITMEDARPSGGGEIAGASQLAPQEIYRAGEGSKGVGQEVVGKSGLPAGREEMSRDEKKRRRRREKERRRKEGGNAEGKGVGKKSRERNGIIGDLKKGGVKVIGKKGDVTDVEGREAGEGNGQHGVGRYKL